MAAKMIFFLCLMQGVRCVDWSVSVSQTVEVMAGSLLTLHCVFEIPSQYENDLNSKCITKWESKDSDSKLTAAIKKTGDVAKKDCTTTFDNLCPHHSDTYYFRLECRNRLKWSFKNTLVNLVVKENPRTPTLNPSTLEVKEGTSVSLSCSAPAACLSHPPTLTWTSPLEDSQRTLQENQDKTNVVTSVLSFTASHLHHRNNFSCRAVYRKPDGSPDEPVTKGLTAFISYSPKNTKVSPSGPVPENTNVTLTCSSDANPPVKSYTWYRANGHQETVIGIGRVLTITASTVSRFFFCKAGNDLGDRRSESYELDVQFPPQILLSSGCTKTADQLNCSCEITGNPSPSVHWHLDGQPVNQSDTFVAINKSTNDTHVRSIITVNHPQERDLLTLLCRSVNSLGSASHQFPVNSLQCPAESQDGVLLPVFLSTLGVVLAVCFLLCVIRALNKHRHPSSHVTGETITAASGELTREENETKENDIYVNCSEMRQEAAAHSIAGSQLNSSHSPNPGNAEDLIYADVKWTIKSKRKRNETSVDTNPSGSSYLDEMKCVAEGSDSLSDALEMGHLCEEVKSRNVKKVDCEYAQVKFKKKAAQLT